MGSANKTCDCCVICVGTPEASINANEATPLLTARDGENDGNCGSFYFNLICIVLLFLFLVAGIGIGTYLLINEDDNSDMLIRTDFINNRTIFRQTKLKFPVNRVILLNSNCTDGKCNFLISDGLYEILGWNYRSCDDDRTLCIGISDTIPIPKRQLRLLQSFIKLAEDKRLLDPDFVLLFTPP